MESFLIGYPQALLAILGIGWAAFFCISRNYRLKFNILLGTLGIISLTWIYILSHLREFEGRGNFAFILISMPSAIIYLGLVILREIRGRKKRRVEELPIHYFLKKVGSKITFVLLFEIVLINSIAFFIITRSFLDYPPENDFLLSLLVFLSIIFTLKAAFLFLYKLVISVVDFSISSRWNAWDIFFFQVYVLILIFLLNYFVFLTNLSVLSDSLGNKVSISLNDNFFDLSIISLLGIIFTLSAAVHSHYFLSLRVSISQILVSFIILFNLISILNSANLEELSLRTILVIVLALLSHLLVRSVIKETRKKQRIEDTTKKVYHANQTLKELDRAKSDFISTASHQLRSPLSVVKGISSMLLDNSYGKLSAVLKDPLEKIFISNERLIGLIEDLLDVSHLEEGKVDFTFSKVDLNTIAKKAFDSLTIQAKNKKLYLKFKPYKKQILSVLVDEQKITETIINLIDNAIKYTKKGGVTVEVGKASQKARVTVRDTGIGLEKEEIKNLFQKFVRTGRGNKLSTVGTGLGLYVVRKIVEAHRGKIWAQSNGEERGSQFIIELPLGMKKAPDEKFIRSIVMEKKPA